MTELKIAGQDQPDFTAAKYAAREYMALDMGDPRALAAHAAHSHRQSVEGHLEAIANPTRMSSTPMEAGTFYEV